MTATVVGTRDRPSGAGEPLFDQVRHRLARDGSHDVAAAVTAARRESRLLADDTVLAEWDHELSARLTGAGPLEPLLELDGITDVLVNGPDDVWLDRGAGLEPAGIRFASEADVRALAYRLAVSAGRRLDDAAPFVDAHLPDGTRLHAIIPPLTARTTISLRVLARRRLELVDLIEAGTVSGAAATVVRAVIEARLAFLISGGTGSGKTTVLGALLALVAPDQRIVLIEDAAELTTSHQHVVRLVARSANIEGAGAIDLRDLVRQSLRMRPDRVVVGEFRGAEVVELLAALNTGHAGGGATVHANGMNDVPARLEALGALGGLDRMALTAQAAAALDVVLHLERGADGVRRLTGIGWLTRQGQEPHSLDRDGPDRDGLDRDGRDRDGLDRDGLGRDGRVRDGRDRPGLDRQGDVLRVDPVWTMAGLGPGAPAMAAELERRCPGRVPPLLLGAVGPGPVRHSATSATGPARDGATSAIGPARHGAPSAAGPVRHRAMASAS